MNEKNRIFINSITIYIGVFLSMLISLLTVPILLESLGVKDYGLYNLLAGVIAMLSFIKNSLIVTVQRYMNVAFGSNNLSKVNKIYSISTLLYYIIGTFIVIIVLVSSNLISYGLFNIESDRVSIAYLLFKVLAVSTFITTISIPCDALFNVYEEMWLFSVFTIIESILRLLLAISLIYILNYDKLFVYGIGMCFISILVFVIKFCCVKKRYKEIRFVKVGRNDILIIKELFGFIGWNIYSTFARIFSTQGLAVVLNSSLGTAVNAAYGVANQINGCLNQFTSSVEKAFNPLIMKSEGMNNRSDVINMSLLSTKYCLLVYSFFAIPLLSSISFILEIWLKNIPEYTIVFVKLIITSTMISLLTVGVSSIFYAIGRIKYYLFSYGSLQILMVFVAYLFVRYNFDIELVVSLLIVVELLLMRLRLYYAWKLVGLKFNVYFKTVLCPCLKVIIPTALVVLFIPCNGIISFIVLCLISFFINMIFLCCYGLNNDERVQLYNFVSLMLKKLWIYVKF